jgi:hypothetical protein
MSCPWHAGVLRRSARLCLGVIMGPHNKELEQTKRVDGMSRVRFGVINVRFAAQLRCWADRVTGMCTMRSRYPYG